MGGAKWAVPVSTSRTAPFVGPGPHRVKQRRPGELPFAHVPAQGGEQVGCIGAYYPETHVLLPVRHEAVGSNTPAAKNIPVRVFKDGG